MFKYKILNIWEHFNIKITQIGTLDPELFKFEIVRFKKDTLCLYIYNYSNHYGINICIITISFIIYVKYISIYCYMS